MKYIYLKKTILNIASFLILFSLFFTNLANPVLATGGYYSTDIIEETRYVDKYFEIDKDANVKINIFLGDQKIATVDDEGTTTFPLTDHLGSPTIITNQNAGIVEINDYEPYGKVNYNNSQINNNYKFTGQEYDDENNLQYFGVRHLGNEIGRFTSVDPAILVLHNDQKLREITNRELQQLLSNPQNLNSYAYAINNPVIYVDSNGEFYGQFGRDMASGQRQISSFLYRAADYKNNQGGFFNRASGLVTNTIADFVDNVADIYDPDQRVSTRVMALGLVALDANTGGKGKVAGKALNSLDGTFAKAAEHAVEQGHFIGKTADEIKVIAKDTYKNFDIKATISGVKKYFYNIKDNILFINNPVKPTVFKPDDALDYLRRAIKSDLEKY